MLEIKNVYAGYDQVDVLHDVSLSVPSGKIVSLIGVNGAGKTTTLATLSGFVRPSSGAILLEGAALAGLSSSERVRAGISLVPEGRQVIAPLSVADNLLVGAHTRKGVAAREIDEDLERIFTHFPRLRERRKQAAGTLSGGEQQMLAMGRALMARPRLLLLDEPSMGLAPLFIDEIFRMIEDINASGTTILLVEQNARRALAISDYAYALEGGRIIEHGTGKALLSSPFVTAGYLGGKAVSIVT